MRRRSRLLWSAIMAVIFLLAGSGWSAPPPDTKPASVPAPAAAPEPRPVFTFNPAGKPDPFKPFVEAELAMRKRLELAKKKNLPVSPLQRAGVESFRLLGIAGNNTKRLALIQDAAGRPYYLSVDTYIGLHNGRVVAISSDRVVVEEPVPTKVSRKGKTRIIEMKLRKEGEEGRP